MDSMLQWIQQMERQQEATRRMIEGLRRHHRCDSQGDP